MDFEFDLNKSIKNKEKHGIDFYEVQKIWDDKYAIIIPAKTINKEKRYAIIGNINSKCWIAIFTLRNSKYRIISARRCRKKEEEIYEKNISK